MSVARATPNSTRELTRGIAISLFGKVFPALRRHRPHATVLASSIPLLLNK